MRVDRLTRPAATGTRFTARTLPANHAAAYLEQNIAGAGSCNEARVSVHAPADKIAARIPWVPGALDPIDAHRCEYRISDDDLDWLAIRIAMLGVDVHVHEPPELITQLNVLGRRLRRAAGE